MATEEFQINTLAETTAIKVVLKQVFGLLAKASDDPEEFLEAQIRDGTEKIETIKCQGLTEEQYHLVIETALNHFTGLVSVDLTDTDK